MGNRYDGTRNEEVWAEWYDLIERNLAEGVSVVADATNLPGHHRDRLRETAKVFGATTHVFVFKNIGQAVRRNFNRDEVSPQGSARVSDSAMMSFVLLYERMLVHIETEEYDSVTYIERTT